MALPQKHDPSNFGINKASDPRAGRGQGHDKTAFTKGRYWYRSQCHNAKVAAFNITEGKETRQAWKCVECGEECELR